MPLDLAHEQVGGGGVALLCDASEDAAVARIVDPSYPAERQAFILKMLEDQSTEEICKVMDISANYLWVLLHRARSQLKVSLEAKWINKDKKA